ncbi:MAG TPA: hypothetical protein VFQ22_06595 [Longimicrobiales bacterium]|nr:hypothetical protein [Longimicrobiales bacterium]
MKRIVGLVVGILYLGLAAGAFLRARPGWEQGHTDIGFWWTVVTALLVVAALAAMIGGWIHSQGGRRPAH